MTWNSTKWANLLAGLAIVLFVIEAGMVMEHNKALETLTSVAQILCIGVFGLWFLVAFTGDARQKTDSMFLFAYVFTLVSFGMLVLPPPPSNMTDDRSPLSVVRGCAVGSPSDASLITYPKSMLCAAPTTAAAGLKEDAASAAGGDPSQLSLLVVGGFSGERIGNRCIENSVSCDYVRIASGLAVERQEVLS